MLGARRLVLVAALASASSLAVGRTQDEASVENLGVELARLTLAIEEHPDDPAVQDELARTFRAVDAAFGASERWSDALAENYCWSAVFLTVPGVPESLLDHGRDATRIRAADLALRRPDVLAGPGRELERAIANDLWTRGRSREALPRLEHAIRTFSGDPECVALLACEQGQVLLVLNEVEAAERALVTADSAREECAACDATTLASIERLRFAVQLVLGVPDHAAITFERIGELLAGVEDPVYRELLLADQGNLDLAGEHWETLVARCRTELESAVGRLSPACTATLNLQLGQALHELAFADPSSSHLERAVAAFERALAIGVPAAASVPDVHLRLADLQRRRGDLDAARRELRTAREMYGAASGPNARTLAEERARLATVAARIARAEGAPAAELEERLAELESAYREFLEHWRSLPRRADGVGFLHYGERRAVLCEMVGLLIGLRGPSEGAKVALEHLMRAQALGTFAGQLGGAPPDLAEARATLCGPGRGVLIVLPGPERSFAFAFDREREVAAEIDPLRDWKPLQSRWVETLVRSPRKERNEQGLRRRRREIAEMGGELARKLLPAPIESELGRWTGVSIVGLEWIDYLPFEVLPFRGDELGLRLAVGYVPSLSVGCLLARRAAEQGSAPERSGLRWIGAPTEPPAAREFGQLDPIAWNEARERALGELFVDFRSRRGDDATLAALRELCDPQALVLEIMAHGFFDGRDPPPAGFALCDASPAHDGLVRARDLEGLSAPPLVALAVCGAAQGPLRSGDDGVAHLGGAFLRAGAQAVMFAFSDVEQTPTERLFDAAYADMVRTGASPAEALLHARRELASREATRDPFDHALVHVVGLAFEPVVRTPRPEDGNSAARCGALGAAALAALVAIAATLRSLRRRPG